MALIKCMECQKEISSAATACPNCGAPSKTEAIKKTGKNAMGTGCAIILCGFLFVTLLALISPSKKTTTVSPSTIEESGSAESGPALELQKGWEFTSGKYGNSVIKGTVKNNSQRKYSYAHITFGIYDKSGAKIGTALANINNLDVDGLWKFEASVLEDNAYTARLEEVEGF